MADKVKSEELIPAAQKKDCTWQSFRYHWYHVVSSVSSGLRIASSSGAESAAAEKS